MKVSIVAPPLRSRPTISPFPQSNSAPPTMRARVNVFSELRPFVHVVSQSPVGKMVLRTTRRATVRLLSVAREIGWLRRWLRLPKNGWIDLVHSDPVAGLSIIALPPTAPFRRALPNFPADPEILPFFKARSREESSQEYVAVLDHGSVWGYAYGAVFTRNEHFVPMFARDPWGTKLHQVWTSTRLPVAQHLAGRVLYLVTPEATDNYHHWLVDLLPRIGIVKRAGFSLDDFNHIVINHSNRVFQWETLEQLGVRKERVIQAHPSLRVQADELVVPSLKRSNEVMPSYHVRFLRDSFLAPSAPPSGTGRRLMISRKDASARRLLNEDEIFAFLRPHGFESVTLSGKSVAAQAKLFSEAEMVVGASGAAFANLVFARPGTRVIELTSPSWITQYHWMISARRGLHHSIVLEPGDAPPEVLNIVGRSKDLKIDVRKLAKVFESIVNRRSSSPATPGLDTSDYSGHAMANFAAAAGAKTN